MLQTQQAWCVCLYFPRNVTPALNLAVTVTLVTLAITYNTAQEGRVAPSCNIKFARCHQISSSHCHILPCFMLFLSQNFSRVPACSTTRTFPNQLLKCQHFMSRFIFYDTCVFLRCQTFREKKSWNGFSPLPTRTVTPDLRRSDSYVFFLVFRSSSGT